MKDIEQIAFILYAHYKSERVKEKMTRKFADSCLFEIALKKLIDCKFIPKENKYVALYDQELIEIAKKYDIQILPRSKKSAYFESGQGEEKIKNCYEWWDKLPNNFKYYLHFNACQPLLKIETIENSIKQFLKSKNRSLISAIKVKDYFWDENENLESKHFKQVEKGDFCFNSKYVCTTNKASHTLQIGLLEDIGKDIWLGSFKKDDPELFYIDELESYDIDYPFEFNICEFIYKNQNKINILK